MTCVEAVFPAPLPYDLARTVSAQQFGPADPTMRVQPGEAAKAAWTPEGPVSVQMVHGHGRIRTRAWGPGAAWATARLAGYLGLDDPHVDLPEPLAGRLPGMRLQQVPWLHETLYEVILRQRVQTDEAHRSHVHLVRRHGEDAPGDLGLRLAPRPERLARLSGHEYFMAGVDGRRAAAVREALVSPRRLAALHDLPREESRRRLAGLPGVGPWTRELVMGLGLGDPDAVPTGDYWLPHAVSLLLAGEPRATDERMVELLEPFRGQRFRAVRLILLTGGGAQRRGPRLDRPGPAGPGLSGSKTSRTSSP